MPQNWKTYKLSEAFEIIGGGTPKTKIKEYWDGDIPWLSVVDFNNDNRTVNSTEKSITGLGLQNSSTKILSKGQLIISARGTVGQIAQLGRDMAFNQSCYGLSGKEKLLINDFGYYLLKSSITNIQANSHGSVFDTITRNTFDNIDVSIPDIQEQKSIASILSALDDKIEGNLQMNKTLEEMTMALYKHWFVDFGPFQDGEFVATELGEIPKGWEVKHLKDFALLIMGQSPKSEFYNDNKEGLPFHQGVKDYGIRFPTDITYSTAGNREAAKGDILFSVRAPVGRLNVAKNKIILGRGLAAIRMPQFNSFLFYALKRMFTTEDSIGSGTVFNSVNKSELENLKFVIPPEVQLLNFKNIVDPLDQQYFNNSTENQTLTQLRDTLLPKLISGEVLVKDVEKIVTEVI